MCAGPTICILAPEANMHACVPLTNTTPTNASLRASRSRARAGMCMQTLLNVASQRTLLHGP